MKSKQVLSIEQMRYLQELGLDTGDASMYWARVSHGSRIYDNSKGKWFLSLQKEFQTCGFVSYETLPAYTLQDIMQKLPPSINICMLHIYKAADLWYFVYMDSYTRTIISTQYSPDIMSAAYQMLCWVIENGYLETNK